MKANYHTHTSRCGHAEGRDEEYVLAAIGQGFEELGFSDHVPWPYKSGYLHLSVRMDVRRLDEYLQSVRALRDKYADKIRILAGFECEYFPEYMGWLSDMAQEKQLDYLILGNHYENSDETGMYFGSARTAEQLSRYVRSTVAGVQTGLFTYLAHPDLFMRSYKPFDENCRAAARDLCQACREAGLPMEYNVHDRFISFITRRVSYPNPEFFEIARQEGVQVVIGLDAHDPVEISNTDQWDRAQRELADYGAGFLDRVALRGFSR